MTVAEIGRRDMTISMCPIVVNFRGCYRVHPSPRLQITCRHVMLEKPKLEEPEKQAKLKARRGGQRYQKSTLYVSFRATVTLNLRGHYLASLKRAENRHGDQLAALFGIE
jgi:hypothetical protein